MVLIPTFTGSIDVDDPNPTDVNLPDIIHGLACTPRYRGQCPRFFSVAQHSILVARHSGLLVEGTLHDSEEAYLGDENPNLKTELRREREKKVRSCIFSAFGVPEFSRAIEERIKEADRRVLATEIRDLWGGKVFDWGPLLPPYEEEIFAWDPERSEKELGGFIVAISRVTDGILKRR